MLFIWWWSTVHYVWKKSKKESEITDISLLPPCRSVLLLHTLRLDLVAYIWSLSCQANVFIDSHEPLGWYNDLSIRWCDEHFPIDCKELLTHDSDDLSNENFGMNEETDEFEIWQTDDVLKKQTLH